MKKYLLGFLILGVMVALSPTVYADWAEISESSTRDVEWAGEIKADQPSAKQGSDLKLRQLSEQAENLRTTATGAASVSITASAAVVEISAANDSASDVGTRVLLVDEPAAGGIGSLGTDNPTIDNPPADNPPANDPPDLGPIIIREPIDGPGDVVPGEPGMPGDDPSDPAVAQAVAR